MVVEHSPITIIVIAYHQSIRTWGMSNFERERELETEIDIYECIRVRRGSVDI